MRAAAAIVVRSESCLMPTAEKCEAKHLRMGVAERRKRHKEVMEVLLCTDFWDTASHRHQYWQISERALRQVSVDLRGGRVAETLRRKTAEHREQRYLVADLQSGGETRSCPWTSQGDARPFGQLPVPSTQAAPGN